MAVASTSGNIAISILNNGMLARVLENTGVGCGLRTESLSARK